MFWRSVFNISIVCFFFHFITLHDLWNVKRTDENSKEEGEIRINDYDVVIGVLSARGNYELRRALRDTWIGHVKNNAELSKRVLVKFIVGDRSCHYPVHKRLDEYGCEVSPVKLPVSDKDFITHRIPAKAHGLRARDGAIGIDFLVNHPIVVTQLGIFDSDSDGFSHPLTSRLYDAASKEEVVSVSFTPENPGKLIGSSRFKDVDSYILPKGFKGTIVAESFDQSDPCAHITEIHQTLDDGEGLITFKMRSRVGGKTGEFPDTEDMINQEEKIFAAGMFIFHAHVLENVDSALTKEESTEDWQRRMLDEEKNLLREQEEFQDIVFVSVIDVYRNIPRKMLHFYKWVSNNISFKYIIKTDDDCYVNIQAILEGLERHKLRDKTRFWWSRFRSNWLVERHGKWQEPNYSADIYPTFACGAGSLLSADLIHWLGKNAADLKVYQGEDVSLGIWLASVGPTFLKDKNWTCFQECNPYMYTSPQQNPKSLRQMWYNFKKCGNPCSLSP